MLTLRQEYQTSPIQPTMNTWVFFLLTALCAQSVLGSPYHGAVAKPVVLKSGYLADTHEVAAAKSAHLAAITKESHHGYVDEHSGSYGGNHDHSYGHGHDIKYHGPTAIPHVLKNGHIADTHEVAAAKSAHLAAIAKESHHGYFDEHSGSYGGDHDHSYGHGHDMKYHGPTAIPHVMKNSHIEDTHEVAAAKAEHYAAVAKSKAHGGYGQAGDYENSQEGSYGHGHSQGHHGALAKPVVLPSGYLADTHEVQVARHRHLSHFH